MHSEDSPSRDTVLKLMEQKDDIEKELQKMKEILDRNGVGMSESLVDPDGYPRQDIDVYQVRHARHKIICLQNDYKEIMKEIEKGLHVLHSRSRETVAPSPRTTVTEREEDLLYPIAKVSFVESGSPADIAGLCVDDFLLSYGSIKYDNFKSLKDIGELTQHSVGRQIPVSVRRKGKTEKLILVPNEWKGKGLLGCNILPVEHVER